jgi:protein-S-isoprenylcysteine O-methyltransferase Ste14
LIEWVNVITLIVASLAMLYLYVKSVRVVALEEKLGEVAYKKCGRFRLLASVAEFVVIINYFIYSFYPLEILGLPQTFPWEWGFSIFLALIIGVPSALLMLKGLSDAGREAMFPQEKQVLYQGIYRKIRHPQAVGELPLWWSLALILNSPFLAIYSFVWIPIFFIMMREEEKDLLIRFGEDYQHYMNTTSMIIPNIFRKGKN